VTRGHEAAATAVVAAFFLFVVFAAHGFYVRLFRRLRRGFPAVLTGVFGGGFGVRRRVGGVAADGFRCGI